MIETLRPHRRLDHRQARRQVIELLERVRIPEPARRIDAYPMSCPAAYVRVGWLSEDDVNGSIEHLIILTPVPCWRLCRVKALIPAGI